MNVLRITRHAAGSDQVEALRSRLGDIVLVEVDEAMPTDSKAFVARFDELAKDAEVVEAVLPLNLMEAVLKFTAFAKRGGRLIRASMNRIARLDEAGNQVKNDKGETVYDFVFDHYEVVRKIEIVTEMF